MNGRNASEGRLEVSLDKINWGMVCDDCWNMSNSDVVCRQLGYDHAYETTDASVFGEGSCSMSIHLDDVRCSSNEASLSQCLSRDWNISNCGHHEDVGVRCYGKITKLKMLNIYNVGKEVFHCIHLHYIALYLTYSPVFGSIFIKPRKKNFIGKCLRVTMEYKCLKSVVLPSIYAND